MKAEGVEIPDLVDLSNCPITKLEVVVENWYIVPSPITIDVIVKILFFIKLSKYL